MEGCGVISRQHLDKPVPYKYVFSRGKGPDEYEFIYKPQRRQHEHVNRCLRVEAELLGPGRPRAPGLPCPGSAARRGQAPALLSSLDPPLSSSFSHLYGFLSFCLFFALFSTRCITVFVFGVCVCV